MKQLLKNIFFATLLAVVVVALHSCDTPSHARKPSYRELSEREAELRRREEIRRTYRIPMETAALHMTKKISGIISPQSGRNWHPSVDIESMDYYESQNVVVAYVILRWEARDFWSGVSYGTCEVGGTLSLYMPYRSVDSAKATFQYQTRNQHVQKVSESKHWEQIRQGLTIMME
ncbi:hypothetical protein [Bacteroides heparinolyticus]|uniref:hypothetical protein n=1 Tax=Prevotella heparinolytica TaxID=28113 RepID=UPI0035A1C467